MHPLLEHVPEQFNLQDPVHETPPQVVSHALLHPPEHPFAQVPMHNE